MMPIRLREDEPARACGWLMWSSAATMKGYYWPNQAVQEISPGNSSRIFCFDPVASRDLGVAGAMKSAISWEMPYSNHPTL